MFAGFNLRLMMTKPITVKKRTLTTRYLNINRKKRRRYKNHTKNKIILLEKFSSTKTLTNYHNDNEDYEE